MDRQETNFLAGIEERFGKADLEADQYSALALAYIGDGVFDLIVRSIILNHGNGRVKNFHRKASSIVKAETQAKLVKSNEEELTEKENRIFHHGRNAKSPTSAKNASIVDSRSATGFEALMGYLYLNHEMDRALELVQMGFERTGISFEK